ncbi:hypothetical protein BLA23254_06869 [Burkholderia lata]|uniref:Uncharacterized protein n=1 Tax=Burkholderia lata (strain ATCC 17760 / DSM 23089 / LMG 22485 / NCIMB 9086 / R18194 / 383) TaxID=482957 RepID=A0A6P2RSB9_BURL3|nr:hypothetical protein [Burkholderia lata]VWC39676.1 hypothetical protein BLA23254_06869 [Burkholderia lata]
MQDKIEVAAVLENLRAQASTRVFAESDDRQYFVSSSYIEDHAVILRILIERAIIRRAVSDILADREGYTVRVWDGEAYAIKSSRDLVEIMGAIMATDSDALIIHRPHTEENRRKLVRVGSMDLVYGNSGWDVISDHADNDETNRLIAGAVTLADAFSEVM